MPFFRIDHRMYAHTCNLVQVADTIAAEEVVIHSNIKCSAPFPVGRDYVERSFHHTPDIGMADPGRPYVIFLKAGGYTPTPGMRVKIDDRSYGIRVINEWTHTSPQFYEIMLELP